MKRFLIISCSSLFLAAAFFVLFLFPAFSLSISEEAGYLPMLVKPGTCIYPTQVPWPPPGLPTPPGGAVPSLPPPPTPAPSPCGDVRITAVHYAGSGTQEPDEYVEIKNIDNLPILLQDWTLRDKANHVFTFPSYLLEPGKSCRIYTNEHRPDWCGFSFRSASPIWNNDGDTLYLWDSEGGFVLEYSY